MGASNNEAPLWCKLRLSDGEAEPVGYNYIRQKILAKTADKAEIEKPCNPHHYRHSRASFLANEMTEAQLCEWFGWVQGSDVPAKYVHLSGRDIDNAYDSMHGLYEPDEEEEKPSVIECYRCKELNEPDAAFCSRCGQALDIEVSEELERAQEKAAKTASPEDLELATKLVHAMQDDKDAVENFVNSLDS